MKRIVEHLVGDIEQKDTFVERELGLIASPHPNSLTNLRDAFLLDLLKEVAMSRLWL